MHSAPAVSYPVGRSRFQVTLLALIAASSAAALLAWAVQSAAPAWRHAGAALCWLAGTLWMLLHWWRTPSAALAWDGSGWSWSDATRMTPVQPEVVLDLQSALLLRLRDPLDGRSFWVWPERRSAWPRWAALRRAVYSPQPGGVA